MEPVLNLLWLVLSMLLTLAVLRARSAGQLRCSLAFALGCTALLALVLFPALSMTDDLQRARLECESLGHGAEVLLTGALDDVQYLGLIFLSALLVVLLTAAQVHSAMLLARRGSPKLEPGLSGTRPEAVRPPPQLRFA